MAKQAKWEVKTKAIVHHDGHLSIQGTPKLQFIAELKLHKGEIAKVSVTPYDPIAEEEDKRSKAQNRYYHKCLDLICEHTGENHLKLHEDLKVELLGRPYVYKDKEVIVVPSTTELTTKTFGDYLEKVFNHAATMGIVLPDSKQYYDQPLA